MNRPLSKGAELALRIERRRQVPARDDRLSRRRPLFQQLGSIGITPNRSAFIRPAFIRAGLAAAE